MRGRVGILISRFKVSVLSISLARRSTLFNVKIVLPRRISLATNNTEERTQMDVTDKTMVVRELDLET